MMKPQPVCGTILIVDDAVENLRMLSQLLAEHGCQIRSAKTGWEAIASINAELPDLIILDVRLPDISGFDVCETLKANEKTQAVPVMFLSGLDDLADKLRGFDAGGVDYITKPFVSDEVLVRVQTHLEMNRLRRELEYKTAALQLKNEQLQDQITERALASEKLAESVTQLQNSKAAALNLLEDLKTEVEQRKRTEENLRDTSNYLNSLIDYANAPIITWNAERVITKFNHVFERLTGFSESEIVGQKLPILFPETSHDESLRQIALTSSGTLWESVEIPIQRKDGEIRVVLWNSANIYDKEGKAIVSTIAQGQDITERKQAQEEIARLNNELKQKVAGQTGELRESQLALLNLVDDLNKSAEKITIANQSLEMVNKEMAAFSYTVSHDLRAPLRSIEGFSQALLEDYGDNLDDDGKNYLQRIRRATQTMNQLIDDLLNLSRVTQVEFYRQYFDLSDVVREIANEIQQSNTLKGPVFDIEDGIVVKADQRLINIAMMNLLDNAWKFTGKSEHPHIEFGASVQKGETVIFVRDNGVGFNMAYAGKIFDTFQRLHRVEEFAGTGIGLATVSRIITRHGGRIWAESEVGKGATFFFTLGA